MLGRDFVAVGEMLDNQDKHILEKLVDNILDKPADFVADKLDFDSLKDFASDLILDYFQDAFDLEFDASRILEDIDFGHILDTSLQVFGNLGLEFDLLQHLSSLLMLVDLELTG